MHRDRNGTSRLNFHFAVSVETNDATGEVMSVYFQVRKGKSARVKEYADGAAFADYDKDGHLLGIELLEPCDVRVLTRIAKEQRAKKFLKETIPRKMALA